MTAGWFIVGKVQPGVKVVRRFKERIANYV